MALVIKGILEESREYYRNLKRENIGRLLIHPRGSLYRKKDGASTFVTLRRLKNGAKRHIYISALLDAAKQPTAEVHSIPTLRDSIAG